MRITDFELYKDILIERSGLTLSPDKSYLLDSRLTPVAKKWGYETMDALSAALRGVPEPGLVDDVVEAMTTNETSFFRDKRPFDTFQETLLPYMIETRARRKSLRIWSAACSSGQEPYSLSMLINDIEQQLAGWRIEITGTDISREILQKAQAGEYSQFEVQRGLPIQLLMKFFEQHESGWKIKDEIRKTVDYKYFNLLDNMAPLGVFDIVYCRNVLIYFDEKTKADVLSRIAQQLEPDGILCLGGAETVLGITDIFKPIPGLRGVYCKSSHTHALENKVSADVAQA